MYNLSYDGVDRDNIEDRGDIEKHRYISINRLEIIYADYITYLKIDLINLNIHISILHNITINSLVFINTS